jgi:hypothetical protein
MFNMLKCLTHVGRGEREPTVLGSVPRRWLCYPQSGRRCLAWCRCPTMLIFPFFNHWLFVDPATYISRDATVHCMLSNCSIHLLRFNAHIWTAELRYTCYFPIMSKTCLLRSRLHARHTFWSTEPDVRLVDVRGLLRAVKLYSTATSQFSDRKLPLLNNYWMICKDISVGNTSNVSPPYPLQVELEQAESTR